MKITQGKFMQPRFVVQQRTLNRDINSAKLTNAQSFGRQTNKSEDIVDLKSKSSQDDRHVLVQKALREQAASRVQGKKLRKSESSDKPSQAQLAGDMLDRLESTFGGEEAALLYGRAEKLASGGEVAPYLAALVYNTAGRKMAALRPELTKEQVASQAAGDPELKQLKDLSDSAKTYLKAVKKDPGTARETSSEKKDDTWQKIVEERLKRLKDTHDTMLKIAETYAAMAAERAKTAAQIHQIHAEAAQAISDMRQETFKKALMASQNHHHNYLKMLTEVTKTG